MSKNLERVLFYICMGLGTITLCILVFTARAQTASLSCSTGTIIVTCSGTAPPQCPSPPGPGPCDVPPKCPSPPGAGPCIPPPQCPSPPGAGPCPVPALSCPGYTKTLRMTADWTNPKRLFTTDAGGFGPNDALVVAFTTGSVSSPNNNLPRISAAEWGTPPSTREATLSPKPCDWSPQDWSGAQSAGTTVSVPFAVGSGYNYGYYPIVPLNATYYFNVRNVPNSSCSTSGICDMAIDLSHPGGMGLVAATKNVKLEAAIKRLKAGKATKADKVLISNGGGK